MFRHTPLYYRTITRILGVRAKAHKNLRDSNYWCVCEFAVGNTHYEVWSDKRGRCLEIHENTHKYAEFETFKRFEALLEDIKDGKTQSWALMEPPVLEPRRIQQLRELRKERKA